MRTLSPVEEQRRFAKWSEGEPDKAIAEAVGVCYKAINSWRHRRGLSRNDKEDWERFWEKVAILDDNQCWEWKAALNEHGYGVTGCNGEVELAHRYSYRAHYGEIPDGLCVLHHCDNPPCVNPRHLFVGTMKDNTQDSLRKGRLKARGATNPMSKLTPKDVREIRSRYANTDVLMRELAVEYGVCRTNIVLIINRKRWKHLDSEDT